MNAHFLQQRLPARAVSMAGIACLHLLLFGLLLKSSPEHTRALPQPDSRSMILWQLPASSESVATPAPDRERQPPRHPNRDPIAPPKLRPAKALPLAQPVTPPALPVQSPAPATPAPAETMTTRETTAQERQESLGQPENAERILNGQTRRELARIASELRKESRFPPDFNIHAKPDKLAQGIAAAYRGDGATTRTEIKLADGRVMTKISGPNGSMCIYKDSVGHTGGRDQIQDGVPTKTTTCPQ